MSTDNAGGSRARRITVEDILDGLIGRTGRSLQPDAGASDEVKAQAEQVVQLAQQLKDAVSKLRQLDPTLFTESRDAAAPQT
jgi:hypothetical protein